MRDIYEYLYHVIEFFTLLSESSASNFATIVNQIHGKQFALSARITPSSDLRFIGHASSDHPSKYLFTLNMFSSSKYTYLMCNCLNSNLF